MNHESAQSLQILILIFFEAAFLAYHADIKFGTWINCGALKVSSRTSCRNFGNCELSLIFDVPRSIYMHYAMALTWQFAGFIKMRS